MGRLLVSHCVGSASASGSASGSASASALSFTIKNLNVKGWLSSVLSLQIICRSNTHAEFLFVRDQAIELIFH